MQQCVRHVTDVTNMINDDGAASRGGYLTSMEGEGRRGLYIFCRKGCLSYPGTLSVARPKIGPLFGGRRPGADPESSGPRSYTKHITRIGTENGD